ncbi:hypothetical protein [Salinispora arenicola]|uniref:hypothetical protein n=1 Tax=Salinispora arenicola TaxID=168697 RepID=UPI00039BB939|nr:hypothetical protein [Salinispora arenicola]
MTAFEIRSRSVVRPVALLLLGVVIFVAWPCLGRGSARPAESHTRATLDRVWRA